MTRSWRTLIAINLVDLLCSFVGFSQAIAQVEAAAVVDGSVTVKSSFQMKDDPAEEKPLLLAGISTEDHGRPSVLSATWEVDTSSWIDSWYVKINSEQGLLSTGTIKIGPVAPVRDHIYEAVLGFDPALGYLSFTLVDRTDGKQICSNSWLISRYVGPVFTVADARADVVAYSWYEPGVANWDVGTGVNNNFMPMLLLEPQGDNWIRLKAIGSLPGEYQVRSSLGGVIAHIKGMDLASGENWMHLSSAALPLGPTELTLQYVEQDKVVSSDTRAIVVGKLSVSSESLSLDSATHTFSGSLVVKSESALHNVALRLPVTLSSIEWNPELVNYVSRPYESVIIDLGRYAELPAGEVVIPISFAVPEKPGLWRVEFQLLADPAIRTTVTVPGIVFSTHTWTALGRSESEITQAGSAQPIRIGTYNIYGFYGYPDNEARIALGYTNDPRRVDYYTNVIKSLQCDIIGIQEGASVEQMNRYAKAAGMEAAAFPSATAYPGGVFTVFPILETRTYNVLGPSGKKEAFSRTGSATLINVHGKLLWVVNIHAHVNDTMLRQREAEILDRELPNLAKVTPNIVVTGDFNSLPGQVIHETLRKHNLYNAMQVLSMVSTNQYNPSIDCVYVSDTLVSYLQSGQFIDNPGAPDATGHSTWRVSDHRPLVVELLWPPEK